MNVQFNFPLGQHNTFGMNVLCSRFIQVDAVSEIAELAKTEVFDSPHYILGGGSNTLFTQFYRGTIIHPAFKGKDIVEDDGENVLVRAAAGEEWSALMEFCRANQLYGLENLVGIPGLVGSSPVQNIGAYGVEVKNCIEKVDGFYTGNMQEFSLTAAQCQFGYRNSVFKNALKGKCFITYVWYKLSKRPRFTLNYKALVDAMGQKQPTLDNVMDTISKIRNSKLPDVRQIGSAGSFFKNPVVLRSQYAELLEKFPDLVSYPVDDDYVKLAAGQLIEKVGWKGKRVGDAGVYPLQALVIVNYGGAKPEDIVSVYQNVRADVLSVFDISLQPEVNIL